MESMYCIFSKTHNWTLDILAHNKRLDIPEKKEDCIDCGGAVVVGSGSAVGSYQDLYHTQHSTAPQPSNPTTTLATALTLFQELLHLKPSNIASDQLSPHIKCI